MLQAARLADLRDEGASLERGESYLGSSWWTATPRSGGPARPDRLPGLTLARSDPRHVSPACGRAGHRLEQARAGLTDEWSASTYSPCSSPSRRPARGTRRGTGGRPVPGASRPRGAVRCLLRPRAAPGPGQELLAHGGRDEGRELLIECWNGRPRHRRTWLEQTCGSGSAPAAASRFPEDAAQTGRWAGSRPANARSSTCSPPVPPTRRSRADCSSARRR